MTAFPGAASTYGEVQPAPPRAAAPRSRTDQIVLAIQSELEVWRGLLEQSGRGPRTVSSIQVTVKLIPSGDPVRSIAVSLEVRNESPSR